MTTVEPAWRRATAGETRWAGAAAIVVAIACQLLLPVEFTVRPTWLIPGLEAVLLAWSIVINPARIDAHTARFRRVSLALIGLLTAANMWSAVTLIRNVVDGHENNAARLLASGAAIWITNMIAFALWYWEFDRGGPGRRSEGSQAHPRYCDPDFMFPQMANPELADPEWEPRFVDYLYTSFTNATAFSPTDVLPLTPWAKLVMMLQSAVSFTTVILVVARAVNTLN